jgi:polysaccharide biosynthesis protein PslA
VLDVAQPHEERASVGGARAVPRYAKRGTRISLYFQLLILDLLALAIGFYASSRIWGYAWLQPDGVNVAVPVAIIYSVLAFYGSGYAIEVLRTRLESIRRALKALFFTVLMVVLIAYYARVTTDVSRIAFATGIGLSTLMLIAFRWSFYFYARQRLGGLATDELLIVDGVAIPGQHSRFVIDAQAERLSPNLMDPQMLGRLSDTIRNFDRVVVAAVPERQAIWSLVLKGADVVGEIVLLEGNNLGAIGFSRFGALQTAQVSRGSLSFANRAKKRLFDLAIALPAIVLLAPLMAVVAVAIKLDSPGPVLFRQPRTGRGNRMFAMLKFRSMRVEGSDHSGGRSTQRADDRVTSVGRIIRKTSIDELPQLFNVLRSDMSIVGPRPHALGSLAGDKLFWEVTERYWLRHVLKPGITGLAQVRGFRGATHEQRDLELRLQSDIEYVNGWTLWRDFVIVLKTFLVLAHPNAY